MDVRECVHPVCYHGDQSNDEKDESHLEVVSPSSENETSATLPKAELVSEVSDDVSSASPGSSRKTKTKITASPMKTYLIPASSPARPEVIVVPPNTVTTLTLPNSAPTILNLDPNLAASRDPATRTTTLRQVNDSCEGTALVCIMVVWIVIGLALLFYFSMKAYYRNRLYYYGY